MPSCSPGSAEPLRLAFGNAAADYERGRPGWPAEIAQVGGLPREAELLDLGAGTGKLTRVLARRFARVVAVEPDAFMRAMIAGVESLEGSAEHIPLRNDSIDGVFCAEAFHWFDWPCAVAEIERILRPRGVLVLCFNLPDGGAYIPLSEAAGEILDRYRRPGVEPGGTILESGAWREPFADPASVFEPLREETFRHVHVQDADAVVSRVLSTSVFAALPDDERRALGVELRSVTPDGVYETRLRADVYWTRLSK